MSGGKRTRSTGTPTERVCQKGCDPKPRPMSDFYSRGTSAEGFKIYDYTCKRCVGNKEKARLRAQRLGTYVPDDTGMKPLSVRDLIACVACGLRGHACGDEDEDGPVCPQARRFETSRLGARGEDWAL